MSSFIFQGKPIILFLTSMVHTKTTVWRMTARSHSVLQSPRTLKVDGRCPPKDRFLELGQEGHRIEKGDQYSLPWQLALSDTVFEVVLGAGHCGLHGCPETSPRSCSPWAAGDGWLDVLDVRLVPSPANPVWSSPWEEQTVSEHSGATLKQG